MTCMKISGGRSVCFSKLCNWFIVEKSKKWGNHIVYVDKRAEILKLFNTLINVEVKSQSLKRPQLSRCRIKEFYHG